MKHIPRLVSALVLLLGAILLHYITAPLPPAPAASPPPGAPAPDVHSTESDAPLPHPDITVALASSPQTG